MGRGVIEDGRKCKKGECIGINKEGKRVKREAWMSYMRKEKEGERRTYKGGKEKESKLCFEGWRERKKERS